MAFFQVKKSFQMSQCIRKIVLFSGIAALTLSGCGADKNAAKATSSEETSTVEITEKEATDQNPDAIILLDHGQDISMAILDTSGNKIKEFEDVFYANAVSEGKIRIRQNDLYGAMDMSGNIIVEPRYACSVSNAAMENSLIYRENRAVFFKDEKYGYLDETGKEVIPARFQKAELFRNGLAAVKENDKWGYIDSSGEYVIQPQYDDADSFFANVAEVKQNGESLIINKNGEVKQQGISIYDPYRSEECQQEGRMVICNENDKYGYMSVDGELIVEPKFNEAYPFSDGVALVLVAQPEGSTNTDYGYIDPEGNYVLEPQYYLAKNFNDGYAYVNVDSTTQGFIDKQGNIANSKSVDTYDFEGVFHDGLAFARDESGENQYIQPDGECVISLKSVEEKTGWSSYHSSFKDGYALIQGDQQKCIIDKEGTIVFGPTDLPLDIDHTGKTGLVVCGMDENGMIGVKNLKDEWVVDAAVYSDILILDKDDEIPEYMEK